MRRVTPEHHHGPDLRRLLGAAGNGACQSEGRTDGGSHVLSRVQSAVKDRGLFVGARSAMSKATPPIEASPHIGQQHAGVRGCRVSGSGSINQTSAPRSAQASAKSISAPRAPPQIAKSPSAIFHLSSCLAIRSLTADSFVAGKRGFLRMGSSIMWPLATTTFLNFCSDLISAKRDEYGFYQTSSSETHRCLCSAILLLQEYRCKVLPPTARYPSAGA